MTGQQRSPQGTAPYGVVWECACASWIKVPNLNCHHPPKLHKEEPTYGYTRKGSFLKGNPPTTWVNPICGNGLAVVAAQLKPLP